MKRLLLLFALVYVSAGHHASAQQAALKTNLLYDATATFNLGAEFRLGDRTSLDVPFNWNPFTFSENRKWKHFLVQPEVRHWTKETFAGHFFGLHAHYAIYNVGNLPKPFSSYMREHRFEGWLAGAGVSYGYRWNLSPRWGLEATAGIGYAYMDYDKFPCARCGDKLGSEIKHYFGPTKLAVSLIYNIGKKKRPAPAPESITLVVIKEEPAPVVMPYAPQYGVSYIVPEAETIKRRSEAGKAFLDFAVGKAEIVSSYKGNAAELEKIYAMIREVQNDRDATVTGMTIRGYASPEGGYASNQSLSERRAAALKKHIESKYAISESRFRVEGCGEDWTTLEELVARSGLSEKTAILGIIRSGDAPDLRERRLASLSGGSPYRIMKAELFPQLRRTEYELHYTVLPFTVEQGKEVFRTRPSSLSLNEMFLIANTYEPGSDEFNELFETAARVFPADDAANLNAAAAALNRGDVAMADNYLAKVKVRSAEYHNNMGIVYGLRGDWEKAVESFREALSGGNAEARRNLAETDRKIENIEAIRRSQSVIE